VEDEPTDKQRNVNHYIAVAYENDIVGGFGIPGGKMITAKKTGQGTPWFSPFFLTGLLFLGPLVSHAVTISHIAPDFSLQEVNGKPVTLRDLQGQNTLLVFGSTSCSSCDALLPFLETIRDTYTDEELHIFFIAVRETPQTVKDYIHDKKIPYPVLIDNTGLVSAKYRIQGVPTAIFIDAKGIVRFKGKPDQRTIRSLLAGESPAFPIENEKSINAHARFAKPDLPAAGATRRFIVELDEPAWFSGALSVPEVGNRRAHLHQMMSVLGGRIIHNYGRWKNRIVVEMPEDQIDNLIDLPGLKHFKEDPKVHALLEDSVYQIKADYAWSNAITGEGITVCVVDTGIDYNHPDLKNKVIAQYDATTGTTDAMDDNGHGTHCAGIIASQGPVYRGVSYDVSLMAAKVLDYAGGGYASDVILGINWAVQQGADVISLSLGEGLYENTCDYTDMAQAVNEAVNAGVVVVCASGNDGLPDKMVSPACASKVIAVGSVDKTDNIASYSDGGPELDLVAPGGDTLGGINFPEIVSCFSTEVANNPLYCLYMLGEACYDTYFVVEGTRYIRAVGTSMATPHVAGAAALMLSENSQLTPDQIQSLLEQNADDLGSPGWDNVYGWGRINLERTLDNLPGEISELIVIINEPNVGDTFVVEEFFTLDASISCFGGDGCGEVNVFAQLCAGLYCTDFINLDTFTSLSILDENPVNLGNFSGIVLETQVPVLFDAHTNYDLSEASYAKTLTPQIASIGSTMQSQHNTGDLEPGDGIGAIGQDAEALYEFELPGGNLSQIKIHLEHYLVLDLDSPKAGWDVYTSNANGDLLHWIGSDDPMDGGGGYPPPPDTWITSQDALVLSDLTPGGTNYIKIVSHGVGENDFLTFNDIEVIVDYEIDPANDETHHYYLQLDLSSIDPNNEVTAARLDLEIAQAAPGGVGQIFLVDNRLISMDPAEMIHNVGDPNYSGLLNPIKTFTCDNQGAISLNIKAAIEEALAVNQTILALQFRELNHDQLFSIYGSGDQNGPVLTISQKFDSIMPDPGMLPGPIPENNPNPAPDSPGSYLAVYDTTAAKDLTDETYTKFDSPDSTPIGAEAATEYNTGDLEEQDMVGAIGQDVYAHYNFEIPAGAISKISVRMEHYLVLQWEEPDSGWYVYTSNANGDEIHLIGDCIPPEGGGGEEPPSDCWWFSEDPTILADLIPGETNYIKLVSHDVGGNDWLTFNNIEVIIEYQVNPDEDNIYRYYTKFDISDMPPDSDIDSAILNLYVTDPVPGAVGEIHVVDNTYDAPTGAFTIYHAEDAGYSNLLNPFKTFGGSDAGLKRINIKPALEDAVESGAGYLGLLISEQQENSLFTLDGSTGANPPELDVYLKSGTGSGTATWNVKPLEEGIYTLRVLATGTSGVESVSDSITIQVLDPNRPHIHAVDCLIDGVWQDCSQARYGDTIQTIRVEATDPQETPSVHLKLTNLPDNQIFLDTQATYDGSYFTYSPNLLINDSGDWQLQILCTDSDNNSDQETITWLVPWGRLSGSIINPPSGTNVPKSSNVSFTVNVECHDGECPDAKVSVGHNKPFERKYDDGSAETYGDVGDPEGFIAVRTSPNRYPAKLKTARFYIYDETTYPFELHIWDNDGLGGEPGTEILIPPLILDPVAPSGPADPNVNWFDVDLTAYNITVNSGSIYIGWKQIGNQNNQVGFDISGTEYQRTWGALYLFGFLFWFNLDDYCDPELCQMDPLQCTCGNIMIRGLFNDPDTYEGILPETAGPAPLYIPTGHPADCGDMNPGESCEESIEVYAVGAVGEIARPHIIIHNNYSLYETETINLNIKPPTNPCWHANLDGLDLVNLNDYTVLANQYLQDPMHYVADINDDGSIDMLDLSILLNYWLDDCN
jgi:subtilisin family serine protease/peroxiredoxin